MRFIPLALATTLLAVSPRVPAQEAAPAENPTVLARIESSVDGFELSPDGKAVVIWGIEWGDPNSRDPKRTGKVQVWDIASRKRLADFVGHTDVVQRVVWSRDGRQLASQSQDGMVALWDAASGKLKHTLAPANVRFPFDRTAAPEEQLRRMSASLERPQLLGFSPDGTQVLALAAKMNLPATPSKDTPSKDKGSKAKPVPLYTLLQPLLRVWDVGPNVTVRSTPFGKRGMVAQSALSPDGKSFVTVRHEGDDGRAASIETRDIDSGDLLRSFSPAGPFNYPTALSTDGRRVLCVRWDGKKFDGTRAQLWDLESQKPLQVLEDTQANLSRSRFSRDGAKILADVPGGNVAIFDAASGKRERLLATGHFNELAEAALTPDGKYLLSVGGVGRDVQRWDLSAPASDALAPRALARASNVRSLHFAGDGSLWFGHGQGDWRNDLRAGEALRLFHVASDGKVLDDISIPEKRLADHIVFSPDFSLAAASLGTQPQPAFLRGAGVGVYDVKSKKLLWHLPGNQYLMDDLAFTPGGRTLITCSNEGLVIEWDMATGKPSRTLWKSKSIEAMALSPDGKRLALSEEGGAITVLDMATGEKIAELGNDPSVSSLAWSPDSKLLASGGTVEVGGTMSGGEIIGATVSVWDAEAQRVAAEFSVPGRILRGIAWSPDGTRLAAAHIKSYHRIEDGRVQIWDAKSKRPLLSLRDNSGAEGPAFAPDGKSLATVGGQWIKAWDLAPQTQP